MQGNSPMLPLALASALALLLSACSSPAVPSMVERSGNAIDGNVAAAAPADTSSTEPDCISYGAFRTSLTSDGPVFPLPVFAPAVERRCVSAYQDDRLDRITIWPAGQLPRTTRTELAYDRLPKTETVMGLDHPDAIEITGTTALGGQANADALLASKGWQTPQFGSDYETKLPTAEWRSVAIKGNMTRAELQAAIESLRPLWRPILPDTKGNDRLRAMDEAANWHRLSDGRHVLAEIGAKPGRTANAYFMQVEKQGAQITAYLFPLEGDSVACYAGKLDRRGKFVDLKMTDPIFGGDEGTPALRDLGAIWPDDLNRKSMRPASPDLLRVLRNQSWGPDLCRKAFANPGKMGLPDAAL